MGRRVVVFTPWWMALIGLTIKGIVVGMYLLVMLLFGTSLIAIFVLGFLVTLPKPQWRERWIAWWSPLWPEFDRWLKNQRSLN